MDYSSFLRTWKTRKRWSCTTYCSLYRCSWSTQSSSRRRSLKKKTKRQSRPCWTSWMGQASKEWFSQLRFTSTLSGYWGKSYDSTCQQKTRSAKASSCAQSSVCYSQSDLEERRQNTWKSCSTSSFASWSKTTQRRKAASSNTSWAMYSSSVYPWSTTTLLSQRWCFTKERMIKWVSKNSCSLIWCNLCLRISRVRTNTSRH